MISLNTQVKASNDQVSCELADESAILDLKKGVYYGLDPVGARIWEMIQQPQSVAAVVAQITDEYDVETEQCTQDVLALFSQLLQNDLIEICD